MERTKEPVISVVVLAYNIQDLVLETLDSIYQQSYPHIELIVSDDCSTDQTVERCQEWLNINKDRFVDAKVVSAEKNGGIPANCNQGIRVSSGDWIKIIAGDDLFYTDAMEKFINNIKQDSSGMKKAFHAKVVEFQDGVLVEQGPSVWGDPQKQKFNLPETSPEEQFKILIRFNPVYAPTVLLHKSIYEDIGYFDERFRFWEDRPMWIKITANNIKMHFLNENVVKYRRHPLSVQINTDQTFFSKTQISMDEGYKAIIIQNLPLFERFLYSYVIGVRILFIRLFKNRKSLLTNLIYKVLVILPEKLIELIRKKYKP
jgi:glycosyltransferase involved in cell wall biosynthesis